MNVARSEQGHSLTASVTLLDVIISEKAKIFDLKNLPPLGGMAHQRIMPRQLLDTSSHTRQSRSSLRVMVDTAGLEIRYVQKSSICEKRWRQEHGI